jgi:hypothetical protein
MTKMLYFFITDVGTPPCLMMIYTSKFASDHVEKLFRKIYLLSFIQLPCTIHNKIQKVESNLLQPFLKQSSYFAGAYSI